MLSNILSYQGSCPHFSAAFLRSRGGLLFSGFLPGSVQPLLLVLNLQGPFFTLLTTSEFRGVEGV